jgi:hypothetical protein
MKRLAAFIVLVAVGLVVPASPAQAAFSSCPSGYLCIYAETYGNGIIANIPPANISYTCTAWTGGASNNVESAYNRTSFPVSMNDGSNCSGAHYILPAGGMISVMPSTIANKASSVNRA